MSTIPPVDIDAMMETIRRELDTVGPDPVSPPATDLEVDRIHARVLAEVARRSHPGEGVAELASTEGGWRPASARLAPKRAYSLHELLAFSDLDFVETAYEALLRRPADAAAATMLGNLRTGAMDKVDVLAHLRWSPEGVARGIHVDGLLVPTILNRWSRKRLVGPFVRWARAAMRLGRNAAAVQSQLAAQSADTHELGRAFNAFAGGAGKRLERVDASLDAIARTLRQAEIRADRGDARIAELKARISALEGELAARTSALEAELVARNSALEAELVARTSALEAELAARTSALEAHLVAREDAEREATQRAERELHAYDELYVDFENHFRGAEALIRARVMPYVTWMRDAGAGTPDAPIVDIGCGRGEWLTLLRDEGLVGKGVDLNRAFLATGRAAGLDVQEGDAIDVLRGMPEGSAGALTSMHLVEHLPFEGVVALIDEALRVLRPGGLLLLETPNPENLDVATINFYLDPTHRNPIPPDVLTWLVRVRGFTDVRIERLHHERELTAPPLLPDTHEGAASINDLLARRLAAPDYAVVARRP